MHIWNKPRTMLLSQNPGMKWLEWMKWLEILWTCRRYSNETSSYEGSSSSRLSMPDCCRLACWASLAALAGACRSQFFTAHSILSFCAEKHLQERTSSASFHPPAITMHRSGQTPQRYQTALVQWHPLSKKFLPWTLWAFAAYLHDAGDSFA